VLLILAVIRSRDDWGAAIDLERYKLDGKLLQAFSVHKDAERKEILKETLANAGILHSLKDPVLAKMHQYVGARIALYFGFVSFYARMLSGMAALSVFIFLIFRYVPSRETTAWTRVLFGASLTFFGTYFTRHWCRRRAILNVKWGLTNFEEDNQNNIRPQFVGRIRKGFYGRGGFVSLDDLDASNVSATREAGQPMNVLVERSSGNDVDFALDIHSTGIVFADLPSVPFLTRDDRFNKLYVTGGITIFFSLCVAAASFLILFFNDDVMHAFDFYGLGIYAPGVGTGLLISVCDAVWTQVSLSLTMWENQRTRELFDNSLITKRFVFQFVSSTSLSPFIYSVSFILCGRRMQI
jgi:Calcium-activated chloride channel